MNIAVKVENLVKNYGTARVIKGLSFQVERGGVFGFLGANGAGKTTTFECVEGLRSYDGGTITVNGRAGVQLQSSTLPEDIKGSEALALYRLWNKKSGPMHALQIKDIENKRYKNMSTGQKRRLHLALALVGDPDILFLDEPTAGLDVESRALLHEEIRALHSKGKTILLASHDMAEVESLCTRLLILKDGNAAFTGTPQELKERKEKKHKIKLRTAAPLIKQPYISCRYLSDEQGYAVFETERKADALYELIGRAKEQDTEVLDIQFGQSSLEESFLDIAKEGSL